MKKQDHVIERIVRLAQNEFPESEIFLYGSRAGMTIKVTPIGIYLCYLIRRVFLLI